MLVDKPLIYMAMYTMYITSSITLAYVQIFACIASLYDTYVPCSPPGFCKFGLAYWA